MDLCISADFWDYLKWLGVRIPKKGENKFYRHIWTQNTNVTARNL